MTFEIRDLRSKWQNYRQALIRADYNHADEQLARAIFFADHNPLIAGILNRVRATPKYSQFNADAWFAGRNDADVFGAGDTNLGFSLDEDERVAQHLQVLEMTVNRGDGGLWSLGTKTYGGGSTLLVDYVHSAIEVLFDPFYHFIDDELRSMESLITPTDMVNQIQSLVDIATSLRYPETHKLLTDAYRQLFSLKADSTGASWYQLGYTCRHVLIQYANEVFEPAYVSEGQLQPKGDDAKEKLKWAVRYALKHEGAGDQYRAAIENIVQVNWDFVNSVGHRQRSATEDDARLAVTYTYLTISIVDHVLSGMGQQHDM